MSQGLVELFTWEGVCFPSSSPWHPTQKCCHTGGKAWCCYLSSLACRCTLALSPRPPPQGYHFKFHACMTPPFLADFFFLGTEVERQRDKERCHNTGPPFVMLLPCGDSHVVARNLNLGSYTQPGCVLYCVSYLWAPTQLGYFRL